MTLHSATPGPDPMADRELFHVALASDWAAAQRAGEYRISTLGKTLDDEGYIHASFARQVDGVLATLYSGVTERLLLRAIGPARLGCEVRVEEAVPGGELFPHICGPIPVTAVTGVTPVSRG
jgi:uncharacterized protein (DUF952 family)